MMALERISADIKKEYFSINSRCIARMTDPALIKEIMNEVSIPFMAKARYSY